MLPLRDVIPSRTTPWVTMSLTALMAVVFLYQQWLPIAARDRFILAHALLPVAFSWPTLISALFIHASWVHLGGNLLCLWIFGDNVEDRMGHGRFLFFYVLAGAIGGLAETHAHPLSAVPIVGASGAVAGVMGAYFVLFPFSRVLVWIWLLVAVDIVEVPAIVFLGVWAVLQLLSGLGSTTTVIVRGGSAFLADACGFMTGVVLVRLLRRPERQRVDWWSGA